MGGNGIEYGSENAFVEAWVCPREYSFDKSAFVNQMDNDWKGFFLGISYRGEAVASFYAGDKRHDCMSPKSLPLAKWSHVAVACRKGAGIELFVNGKSVAKTLFEEPLLIPPQTPLVIRKTQAKSLAVYTSPRSEQYKVWMRFNGLMDELKITGTVPDENSLQNRIAATGKFGIKGLNLPQYPSADIPQGAFGAYYTRLRYDVEEWESLWRVGEHPDIVVRFPYLPSTFTIDLGVEARLSRFNMVPWWQFLYTYHPRTFEVYGTASRNPGDDLNGGDWTLIGKFGSWKPSGDDPVVVTADDQNYAWPGGENFDIKVSEDQPNPYFPIRIVRFRIMSTWADVQTYAIDELSIWGETIK
ncbi:MAG: hypothetical protein LBK22_07245 [Tannerella sp.]|jgi:hypothetical protein|nr:hypothetical protein [Tannerella sp.]